ncbi:MAG: N-acetylmuramoyl-L-alanine amidase [Pseudomonadota bacterium]
MPDIRYLFVHTAAADIPDVDAAVIDRWHRARGWAGIGYHYVILDDRHGSKADGTVEAGRAESRTGAHVRGVNARSLGICCAGHGDRRSLTSAQTAALIALLVRLAKRHDVPAANILGHREVNRLVERDVLSPRYRTSKSCPGALIDMDAIRHAVEIARSHPGALVEAIRRIDGAATELGEARPAWQAFRDRAEIRALTD